MSDWINELKKTASPQGEPTPTYPQLFYGDGIKVRACQSIGVTYLFFGA